MRRRPGSMKPRPARKPPIRPGDHAEVDAELMGLGAGQHLVEGEARLKWVGLTHFSCSTSSWRTMAI
jgi:hypothetical protein